MTRYISARLLATVPVVAGVTFAVFAMLFLIPGDPVKMMLSEFQTNPEQIARMRAQLHLDEPFYRQYGRFVWGAAHGNLGESIRDRRPVTAEITEVLPATAQLATGALAFAALLGITLGIAAAIRQNSWWDLGSTAVALAGVSMPSFWLGLLLIFVFSLHLGWLPAAGGGGAGHLIMPAVALGLGAAAIIARLTRSSMLEVLRMEYMTTARAKGLAGPGIVLRHGLPNALIPIVTIFGLQFGSLLAGTVIIETVFGRPGIGRLLVNAILDKDFPLVQGVVLFVAVGYVLINLAVDVIYAAIDPRIRYG
ncbi:MAG: ABC transporter permease [Bacillati bacterium ANGP1]|uniref:ABC transporter permease n=1 Tax=Candidatus Segetimicrobium genomatis TaxID=2569760 RepID=A0A537KE50_9BACT|nr:MAG: ABC transporter permease [Terrabacteria group bacterium ANGP1]